MKKTFSFATLLTAAFILLSGCSNDMLEESLPAQPGSPITLSACVASAPATRTAYGTMADNNWPILWSEGDEVNIYSPDADENTEFAHALEATYIVKSAGNGLVATSALSPKINSLYWGLADTHNFYHYYAPNGLTFNKTALKWSASIPAEQTGEAAVSNGCYRACNMAYGVMTGHNTASRASAAANLVFYPRFTAVEVSMTAPVTIADFTQVIVKSIEIESFNGTTPVVGNFDVVVPPAPVVEEGEEEPAPVEGDECTYENLSNTAAHMTLSLGEGVTLKNATGNISTLQAVAFLLPNTATRVKITVNYLKSDGTATEGTYAASKVTVTDISAGAYNRLNLGTLPTVINGHEYVDMGDGTLWSTEDLPGLYQWGETTPHAEGVPYDWANYDFNNTHSNEGVDVDDMTKYNATDGKTTLESSDDAATANWGDYWRMPTATETSTLFAHSTIEVVTIGDQEVIKVTSTINGNVLYFPKPADSNLPEFWTSTLSEGDKLKAIVSNYLTSPTSTDRKDGLPVRPVLNYTPESVEDSKVDPDIQASIEDGNGHQGGNAENDITVTGGWGVHTDN